MPSEKREVANFSKIDFRAVGDIYLEQADEFSLTIEAEEHILQRLTSRVDGVSLIIDLEKGSSSNISSEEAIRYHIKMPVLETLRIAGAGKFFAETIAGASLLIDMPGAGTLQLGTINVNAFRLDVNGAGKVHLNSLSAQGVALDVKGSLKAEIGTLKAEALTSSVEGTLNLEVAGEVNAQIIHVPGVINYQAGDLYSNQLTLNSKGMSNLTVWVESHLNARIEGVGNLRYYGSPERTVKINGLGKVNRLGYKPKVTSHV